MSKAGGTVPGQRCKGILHLAEKMDKRFAFQIVGRRTEISELDPWGERMPQTRIVAIGFVKENEADLLTNIFESSIQEPQHKEH